FWPCSPRIRPAAGSIPNAPASANSLLAICAAAGASLRRGRQDVPVHPRLALEVIDRDMRIVPGQARANPEAFGELGDLAFGEPRLGRLPVLPEIDAAGAGIAVEVVLPDQSLR